VKFDVYGRFQLEMHREGNAWVVYRLGTGMRSPGDDLEIPSSMPAEDIVDYLDDMYHEYACAGESIKHLSQQYSIRQYNAKAG